MGEIRNDGRKSETMTHQPGAILYDAWVDDGKINIMTYVCRSTRKGTAFYTCKCFSTWGKKSKKKMVTMVGLIQLMICFGQG